MKTIEMGIGHSSGDGKCDCHIGGKVDGEIDGEVDGDDGGDGFHVLPIVFHSSNTSSAPSPITHLQHGQWSMIDGLWSMVNGRWSMVEGQANMNNDKTS